jgi:hypothetical protein
MVSVLSATRRPQEYEKMVLQVENEMGDIIQEYLAFVNNDNVRAEFKEIALRISKVRIVNAPENYIYRNGFDSIYNTLMKAAKGSHVLMIFDSDEIIVNVDILRQELESDFDIFGFQMYMQRGDSWETKYQLYRNDGLVRWFGLVHENQQFSREPKMKQLPKDVLHVLHMNARDNESKTLQKKDGIIVLEKTEEGTDSDERNLLYESLTWKIIHENGRHLHKPWFEKHYAINQTIIDEYHQRAVARWGE